MEINIVLIDDEANDVREQIERGLANITESADDPPWAVTLGGEKLSLRCRAIQDPNQAETELLSGSDELRSSADLILLDNDWIRVGREFRFGLDLLQRAHWQRGRGPVLAIYTSADTFKPEFIKVALASGADALVNKNESTHFLNLLLVAVDRKKRRLEDKKWQKLSGVLAEKDPGLVTSSPLMRKVLQDAVYVAPWRNEIVLLLGETGTGKSRLAKALHDCSPRAAAPFVTLDPGHISDTLVHAELFGAERGAFTDARARKGLLETAEGGTVFVDELENMSPSMQEALLRVIQDRRYFRPGDPKERQLDARFFFATNQEPLKLVEAGKLREDLHSRIDQNIVRLPPLRERLEDIPLLTRTFINEFYAENMVGASPPEITQDALDRLRTLPWRDNIRGLRNTVRRSLVRLPTNTDVDASSLVLNQEPGLSTAIRTHDLGSLLELAPRAGSQRTVFDRLIESSPDTVTNQELNVALGLAESDVAADALMTAISRLRERIRQRGFDIRQDRDQKGYSLVRLVDNA